MNIPQTVQVFKAILQGPVSRIDLAKRVDMCPKTIGKILGALKAEKLIRVADYALHGDGRNKVKIYTLGSGADIQPKHAISEEERARRKYLKAMRKLKQEKMPTPITTFVGGKSLWR